MGIILFLFTVSLGYLAAVVRDAAASGSSQVALTPWALFYKTGLRFKTIFI